MPTIMPQSELLRRAVAHVCDVCKEHPEKPLHIHIDDAAMRYNLSPADTEALNRLFEKTPPAATDSTGD